MINQIYGRFQQKHDTEANWLKATNFAPLEGELIVYDADENHNYPRFKVGIWDGTSEKTSDMLVNNLPFEGGYTNEEIDALLKNLNSENITVKQTGLGTTTIGPGTLDLLDSKDTTVFSIDSDGTGYLGNKKIVVEGIHESATYWESENGYSKVIQTNAIYIIRTGYNDTVYTYVTESDLLYTGSGKQTYHQFSNGCSYTQDLGMDNRLRCYVAPTEEPESEGALPKIFFIELVRII